MTITNKQSEFSKRFKPCMLVMFAAHLHRAHDYKVRDRKAEVREDGTEISSWSTTKIVQDPENAKKAAALRATFINNVVKLGAQYGTEKLVFVDFERRDDLEALQAEWQSKVEEFNAQSPIVKVDFFCLPPLDLTGSNEYMLGKLLDEMKDTMGEMKEALQAADYKKVRAVVAKLKGFTSLVPDESAAAITNAIADARKQARMIKRELEKRGTAIEEVQAMINTSTVDLAVSVTLLDDDPEMDTESTAELMAALAEQQAAAIDFGDDSEEEEGEEDDGAVDFGAVVAEAPMADPEEEGEEEDPRAVSPELSASMQSWRIDG
jgi:hypothetical protein